MFVMTQLLGFIPSARTLWLLAGGGGLMTILAVLIPGAQGIALALTFGWYFVVLVLAGVDAWLSKADRVQVSRTAIGKLSIGRDNPVTLTIKSGQNRHKSPPFNYQIRDGVPQDLPGTPQLISGRLEPNTSKNTTYTVHPYRRGEYAWQGIYVRQLGEIGRASCRERVLMPV